MKITKHVTSQEAWEYINEYLVNKEREITRKGGGKYGPEIVSYDHLMDIQRAWVDPTVDFGHLFGYKTQKWTKLLSNYMDKNHLDIVKSDVLAREAKTASCHYNVSFSFINTHASGKGCLLSLTFVKRLKNPKPLLILHIRSSEVTKRLLLDLLLVQRIGEYVYGEDAIMGLKVYCPNMYLSSESFCMYNNHRKFEEFLRKEPGTIGEKVWERLGYYQKVDPFSINYKVFRRIAHQVQFDEKGHKIKYTKPLLAGDLYI